MNPRKDKGDKIQIRTKIKEIEKQRRQPMKSKDREKKKDGINEPFWERKNKNM